MTAFNIRYYTPGWLPTSSQDRVGATSHTLAPLGADERAIAVANDEPSLVRYWTGAEWTGSKPDALTRAEYADAHRAAASSRESAFAQSHRARVREG